jgi:hypothetical protein
MQPAKVRQPVHSISEQHAKFRLRASEASSIKNRRQQQRYYAATLKLQLSHAKAREPSRRDKSAYMNSLL